MGAAYSQDLRERILAADEGETSSQIAQRLLVSPAYVRRVRQRAREFGEMTPRPAGGARNVKINTEVLSAIVAERPDATLVEIARLHGERTGVEVSDSGVDQALRRLKLSYKKSRSVRPSKPATTWRPPGRPGRTSKANLMPIN